jgi:hypothetical protein
VRAIVAGNDKRIARLLAPPGGCPGAVALALDPEPPDGLLIAVQALQLPRFSRRFAPGAPGDAVYAWLASRPEIAAAGLKCGEFELASPQGAPLAVAKTLAEQGVQNRSIFHLKRLS